MTDALQSDLRTTAAGNISLATTDGSITLNDGTAPDDGTAVSADTTGNIYLSAGGSDKDLTLSADTDVVSGGGNITLLAGRSVLTGDDADVTTLLTGTIDVEAGAGSITMDDNSLFSTGSGNIRLLADQDVTLGGLLTTGKASVTATDGSILDGGDTYTDVVADSLRLWAGTGIGEDDDPIETNVATISARATSGGMYIQEANDIAVNDVVVAVNKVAADGTTSVVTDALQSDLRTTAGNGNISLVTTNGNIVLNDGTAAEDDTAVSAHGSGNVFLHATGATKDLTLNDNADVLSGTGDITLLAGRSVITGDDADVATDGSIDVEAGVGSITMDDNSLFDAGSGNIRLLGAVNVTLGGLLTTAKVSVTATSGTIYDGGDTYTDVVADSLRLWAGTGIGENDDPIETNVAVISARAGSGGMYIQEANGITVDDVVVAVDKVAADGTTSVVTDALQSDLRTTAAGNISLATTDGSITLNNDNAIAANGSGNVYLSAGGSTKDLTLNDNADLASDSGHVTLLAGRSLITHDGTAVETVDGTIDMEAGAGSITMDDNSRIDTGSGNIRLLGAINVTLGGIVTTGNVSIKATSGSILDGGDTYINVTATDLRMLAGNGIGTGSNAIEIDVNTLSGRAQGGGINVLEADTLTIDDVNAVPVFKVNPNGTTTLYDNGETTQSDIRTTADSGSIKIKTTAGDITLNDGTAPADDTAVAADGNGSIIIEAAGSVWQNANITTPGSGDITVIADIGDIVMAVPTTTSTGSGDITYSAGDGLYIDTLQTLTGRDGGTVTLEGDSLNDVDPGTDTSTAGSVVIHVPGGVPLSLVAGLFDVPQAYRITLNNDSIGGNVTDPAVWALLNLLSQSSSASFWQNLGFGAGTLGIDPLLLQLH